MFAPNIFPTDIALWFFFIAVKHDTSSGSDVPNAITVKLITACGIPIAPAIITPLLTLN